LKLECQYYNSGNISSAKLDNESISNSHAKSIISVLDGLWYDCKTNEYNHKYGKLDSKYIQEIIQLLV